MHGVNQFTYSASFWLQVRVAAVFAFISFASLLSIAGLPAHIKEIKVCAVFALREFDILHLMVVLQM